MNKINTKPENGTQAIVFIHGFFGHRFLMIPWRKPLRKSGYKTLLFGYRSVFSSIETHAKRFRKQLDSLNDDPNISQIHIVSHSMGGIVIRQALLESRPSKLARIVMLAPPNQGSPAATRLSRWMMPFCKTLRQISDRKNSFVLRLPEPVGLEVGIVTATCDRVIPESNSMLECQSDHAQVVSSHNGLLINQAAIRHIIAFLKSGKFADCPDC